MGNEKMKVNKRRYAISGCQNLRDLGGYETKDKRITRWNTCFRCDLPLCDKEGWNRLYEELGIRTIIDLRSSSERAYQDYVYHEERMYVRFLPLLKEEYPNYVGNMRKNEYRQKYEQSMSENYLDIVLSNPEGIVQILMEIHQALIKGAVLFHCTAGKDRTGILSFFLLWLAQVDSVDIMADYQVSSTYALYGNISTNTLLKELQKYDTSWMHALPEALGVLIDYFSRYDMKEFLIQYGMPNKAIQEIVDGFTEKSSSVK